MAPKGSFGTRGRAREAAAPVRTENRDPGPEPHEAVKRTRSGHASIWYGLILVAIIAAFGAGHMLGSAPPPPQLVALVAPEAARPDAQATTAALPRPSGRLVERQFSVCGSGKRITCVVDGDTIWLEGEKIRIADINTPEVSSPACATEARLAAQATRRLRELLNEGPFEVRREGRDEDRYGRKLRTIHRGGQSLGDVLVSEGLAHAWKGRKESWCG